MSPAALHSASCREPEPEDEFRSASVAGENVSPASGTPSALYLIDNVDQSIGSSNIGCGDGGATNSCDLIKQYLKMVRKFLERFTDLTRTRSCDHKVQRPFVVHPHQNVSHESNTETEQ